MAAKSAASPRRGAYSCPALPLPRPLRRQQATAYMLRATSAATTITCSIAILDTSEASRSPRGECRCRVCPASPCDQQYGTCLRSRTPERAKPCSRVGREGRAGRERASARTSHPALNYRVRTANGRYQPPNGESHAAQSAPDPPTPRKDEKTVSHMTPQAGVVICTSPDKLRPPLDVCLRSTRSFWSRARARWASRR